MPNQTEQLQRLADTIVTGVVSHLQQRDCRLVNRAELARILGISERGVTGLAKRREIPAGFLIGGIRRWDWIEVRRHLESSAKRSRRKGRGRYDRATGRRPQATGATETGAGIDRSTKPANSSPPVATNPDTPGTRSEGHVGLSDIQPPDGG